MTHNNERPAREQFGQAAVRLGFATSAQVEQALQAQRQLAERGENHKLIGLVMLELGILGTTELINVLKELARRHHSAATVSLHAPRNSR